MKLRRKFLLLALLVGVGHAELAKWIQDIPSPSRLEAVFFRAIALPSGAVEVRRPPKETRAELGKLISSTPSDASLYALRAREDEQQLDFAAAESDWKKQVELSSNKNAASLDLADFYHRRIRPRDEIAALEAIAKAPASAAERGVSVYQQQSWKAFERILQIVHDQALPPETTANTYREWIARYPTEASVYKSFEQNLVDSKRFDDAQKLIADFRRAFPLDASTPIQAEATLAWHRGSIDEAVRIYDRSFQPLWPPDLVSAYFNLLKESHGLRRYLEQARGQIAAKPTDIGAAARVFYYYQQQGNLAAAQRTLLEYRLRKASAKSAWTSGELLTLAQLFNGVSNYDEAARSYYALYSVPGAEAAMQEKALAGIANLLLAAPEQAIRLGAGDLSMYSDIAHIDNGPGFLNGVLSLLLNSSSPESQFATEDAASTAYFHRARAAELIRLFDSKFPASPERAGLHAGLIAAFAVYGDNNGVIAAGKDFLTTFPKTSQRTQVAIGLADAYARTNQVQPEFALYDDLLKELAAQADGTPIGDLPAAAPPPNGQEQARPARSPDYARILDRYISRLVSMKRVRDAIALYRREIDRNSNDPGLYERFAAFLDQNKMGVELEQTYRRAMAQFQDRTWSHKLARWYLRQKQTAQFDQLTQDVTKIFSGTELESYIRDAGTGQALAPGLYKQVNLYAHQRFPHNLVFVRNLLNAYAQRATADPVATEALLRKYWYYGSDLRDQFFELISRTRRLDVELAALKGPMPPNPAARDLLAEANTWRSHFEEAAPLLQAVAADYPAANDQGSRAASLFRSLATYDAPSDIHNIRLAAGIEQTLTRAVPTDSAALTRLGEIYADRELYNRAKPSWDRIPQIAPGKPDGYLEAATIYWDYFRFDDARRLIDDGRKKLADPALYAYEAGAIYENQRNYKLALAEYAKGALASENSPARARLVQLARRTRDRDDIEQLTANSVSGADPAIAAVSLRADILTAQNRRPDLDQLLTGLADRATSLDLLTYIEQASVKNDFADAQEHSIRRRISLLTDPVERTRERLALARYYEGRRDTAAASGVISALYRENPTILGVVRATVDYYWRNKNEKNAIDALVAAAGKAEPGYRKQFTFEAARKATDAADYSRARTLLASLLKDEPFNSEYLAATGDAYAREGNDTGLRDFYNSKMKEIGAATLSASDRTEKTAGLRRGLIPVLTRLKDYTGAMDQYIEIINRYADDESLVREAALYGAAHGRAQQLTAYYAKTENDSPKDYRWPMTLARIQATLEEFPAAIAEYKRAADIRPDRVDLFTTRASLEERLLRFDDAAGTYAKLYELNYHNSQWMEKVAEIRARQGRTDESVEALRRALVEGRPQRAEVFFAMAEKLEAWGMLPQARENVEKAVAMAGKDLLTDYSSGAQLYARVMTRMRAYDAAVKKLGQSDPGLRQIGSTVALYYTPEEKLAFANYLGANLPTVTAAQIKSRMPMVESAGLADLQAKWMSQLSQPQQLVDFQQKRLRFGELAGQLEAYWKAVPAESENRDALLQQAAENYRLSGDTSNELRLLAQMDQRGKLTPELMNRYAELLNRTPPRFLAVVANPASASRNAFTTYTLDNGNAARALEVMTARGKDMPTVWNRAFTGLIGLYFASPDPRVATAFRDALGTGTIGERVGKPVDRDAQLAGDLWFYYGSRFGEYLDVTKQQGAEDYLPAGVEAAPGHADAYYALAEFYRESGDFPHALEDYSNALQLDSKRGDAHGRIALIDWQQNKRDDATREFQASLEAFAKEQDERHVPPAFWRGLADTLEDIGRFKLLSAIRPQADRVLRTYVRRNGSYGVELLLRAAIRASASPADGVAWAVDLSRAAPNTTEFLGNIVKASWIPEQQRPVVYSALIQNAKQSAASVFGEARTFAEQELRNRQFDWVEYLVSHNQAQQAKQALLDIPEDVRKSRRGQTVPLEVRIAAQTASLKAYLDSYDATFPVEDLQRTASVLPSAAARQVLEFVYTRQLDSHEFSAAAFLGLAEIRLDQGDVPGAVTLLRRMTLLTGEPFEHLSDASGLLERKGHPVEAAPFLADRVKAAPWDQSAKVQLARLQRDQGFETLRAVAGSSDAPYESRADAAQALGEAKAGALTTASVELNLLSGPAPVAPADAQKPYFYRARLQAAAQSTDAATKIRLLDSAAGIAPNSDDTKLALFDAAYRAKRYQAAISAVTPILIAKPFERQTFEGIPGQILDDDSGNFYPVTAFSRGGTPQRIRELADSFAKLNRISDAAFYYRLQPTDAESKAQLAVLQAQLDRQRANRLRQPVISANLEQDHPVRPRLGGRP